MHRILITLGFLAVASTTACKKAPAADPRAVETSPVASPNARAEPARAPRTPEALAPTIDAGALTAVPVVAAKAAIEQIRNLDAYRRLVGVVGDVDKLARQKAWEKAVASMREVESIGKRLRDDSLAIVTKAPPNVTDFVTRVASFVIDARTELSMIEVDQSAEQREKSVKRFVALGKGALE